MKNRFPIKIIKFKPKYLLILLLCSSEYLDDVMKFEVIYAASTLRGISAAQH